VRFIQASPLYSPQIGWAFATRAVGRPGCFGTRNFVAFETTNKTNNQTTTNTVAFETTTKTNKKQETTTNKKQQTQTRNNKQQTRNNNKQETTNTNKKQETTNTIEMRWGSLHINTQMQIEYSKKCS
jgi:hypothetical protein